MSPTNEHDLIALLRARHQRVTPQRLVILRELRRLAAHVTAEQVFRAVAGELPGTSVPTVYATLDLLVELKLARKLDIGSGVAVYDARTDPHGHLVCRTCGSVSDLDLALDLPAAVNGAALQGFEADDVQLVLSGHCAACRAALPPSV